MSKSCLKMRLYGLKCCMYVCLNIDTFNCSSTLLCTLSLEGQCKHVPAHVCSPCTCLYRVLLNFSHTYALAQFYLSVGSGLRMKNTKPVNGFVIFLDGQCFHCTDQILLNTTGQKINHTLIMSFSPYRISIREMGLRGCAHYGGTLLN